MSRWGDLRGDWDDGVGEARRRAQAAMVSLIVTAGTELWQILIALWQIALLEDAERGELDVATAGLTDSLFSAGAIAELVMMVITAVLFLRWLSRVVNLTSSMSTFRLRWTSKDAVWSFFIPFINLARPYHVVRDVHDRLAPDAVPEPAPRLRLEGTGGYRHIPVEKAPPPRALPHASIGAWWAMFLLGRALGNFDGRSTANTPAELISTRAFGSVADAALIAAAILAVMVVRVLQGRLEERRRRLVHASDEELEAWAIGGE